MRYLLDTDIVNYLLKERPLVTRRYAEEVAANAEFVLCPVVHYEATRYLKLKGATRLAADYAEIVERWAPVELVGIDWDLAADLWADGHRAGHPIEDADLLIAVAALKVGATLVTNNDDHYKGLGVRIENRLTGRVIPA